MSCLDSFRRSPALLRSPTQVRVNEATSRHTDACRALAVAWSYVELSGLGVVLATVTGACGFAMTGSQLAGIPLGIVVTCMGLVGLGYALEYAIKNLLKYRQARCTFKVSEAALKNARAVHRAACMAAQAPAAVQPVAVQPAPVPPAAGAPAPAPPIRVARQATLIQPAEAVVAGGFLALAINVHVNAQYVAPLLRAISPFPMSLHRVPGFGRSGFIATALLMAAHSAQPLSPARQRVAQPAMMMIAPVLGAACSQWRASLPQVLGAGLSEIAMFGIAQRLCDLSDNGDNPIWQVTRQGLAVGATYLGAHLLEAMPDNVWLHVAGVSLFAYGACYVASHIQPWRVAYARPTA